MGLKAKILPTESTRFSSRKRVVRNGTPTTDLVLSAAFEGNEVVFPNRKHER